MHGCIFVYMVASAVVQQEQRLLSFSKLWERKHGDEGQQGTSHDHMIEVVGALNAFLKLQEKSYLIFKFINFSRTGYCQFPGCGKGSMRGSRALTRII